MTSNKNIDDPVIKSVTSRAIIPGYKFGSPFNSNDNAKWRCPVRVIHIPMCEVISLDIGMSEPTSRSNISTKSSFPSGFEYRLEADCRAK